MIIIDIYTYVFVCVCVYKVCVFSCLQPQKCIFFLDLFVLTRFLHDSYFDLLSKAVIYFLFDQGGIVISLPLLPLFHFCSLESIKSYDRNVLLRRKKWIENS